MRLLLPLILALIGIAGGGAVGYMLKPVPEAAAEEGDAKGKVKDGEAHDDYADEKGGHGGDAYAKGHDKKKYTGLRRSLSKATDSAYVAIEKKLIVPIQRPSGRKAFVVLDATLEVDPEQVQHVEQHEPKIVDAFLRVMISFAATGAFEDHAETAMSLDDLNDALYTSAEAVLGEAVRGVLIANLITQDA